MEELLKHIEIVRHDTYIQLFILGILVSILFTIMDFVTAIIRIYLLDWKMITSSGIGTTINKFTSLIFYTLFSFFIFLISRENFVLIILYGPILIYILKEFISIGENTSSKDGKTNVIINLLKQIYTSITKLYISKIIKLLTKNIGISESDKNKDEI